MAESFPPLPFVLTDLRVELIECPCVAILRYFDSSGAFAQMLRDHLGVAAPEPGRVVRALAPDMTLAWRSPTETVMVAADPAALAALAAALAEASDGCLIDLTGAIKILRLSGRKIPDLLCRLGGTACVPAVGEARRGRLADVAVMALCLDKAQTDLLVDRAYLPHLLDWIRETLLDFAA
jgi:sarcosine oxidase gamma subunit